MVPPLAAFFEEVSAALAGAAASVTAVFTELLPALPAITTRVLPAVPLLGQALSPLGPNFSPAPMFCEFDLGFPNEFGPPRPGVGYETLDPVPRFGEPVMTAGGSPGEQLTFWNDAVETLEPKPQSKRPESNEKTDTEDPDDDKPLLLYHYTSAKKGKRGIERFGFRATTEWIDGLNNTHPTGVYFTTIPPIGLRPGQLASRLKRSPNFWGQFTYFYGVRATNLPGLMPDPGVPNSFYVPMTEGGYLRVPIETEGPVVGSD